MASVVKLKSGAMYEPDPIDRFARILSLAKDLIGDDVAARHWLKQPNPNLDGESPIAAMDTEIGARRVEEALGRIAYGGIS
jgi:putative toxin-antitoxin system antitoxin component (TIGR02293 family)